MITFLYLAAPEEIESDTGAVVTVDAFGSLARPRSRGWGHHHDVG